MGLWDSLLNGVKETGKFLNSPANAGGKEAGYSKLAAIGAGLQDMSQNLQGKEGSAMRNLYDSDRLKTLADVEIFKAKGDAIVKRNELYNSLQDKFMKSLKNKKPEEIAKLVPTLMGDSGYQQLLSYDTLLNGKSEDPMVHAVNTLNKWKTSRDMLTAMTPQNSFSLTDGIKFGGLTGAASSMITPDAKQAFFNFINNRLRGYIGQ